MNRGWRFCRQGRIVYVVDSSCFLVDPTPSFFPVFGRNCSQIVPRREPLWMLSDGTRSTRLNVGEYGYGPERVASVKTTGMSPLSRLRSALCVTVISSSSKKVARCAGSSRSHRRSPWSNPTTISKRYQRLSPLSEPPRLHAVVGHCRRNDPAVNAAGLTTGQVDIAGTQQERARWWQQRHSV